MIAGMSRPPRLVWDWSTALLGAVYALPGAAVMLSDLSHGLALVIGVLPAAIAGLMPTRRGRLAIVVLGFSIGVPMFIGGVLAGVPLLAVLAIGGLGVGAALLAARFALGQIAMTLSLPMVGIGLSYPNIGKAAGLAGLMVLGSLFGCLVSMFWPARAPGSPGPAGPAPDGDTDADTDAGLRRPPRRRRRHGRGDRLPAGPRTRRLGVRGRALGDAPRR